MVFVDVVLVMSFLFELELTDVEFTLDVDGVVALLEVVVVVVVFEPVDVEFMLDAVGVVFLLEDVVLVVFVASLLFVPEPAVAEFMLDAELWAFGIATLLVLNVDFVLDGVELLVDVEFEVDGLTLVVDVVVTEELDGL